MPAKAPDINVENAIQAYLSGESAKKIAPYYGICAKRLTAILKERGLLRDKSQRYAIAGKKNGKIRHKTLDLPDDEIAKRYLSGETEQTLAKEFGVNRYAISTSLRFTNTPRRSLSDNYTLKSSKIPLKERKPVFNDHPGPYKKTLEQRIKAAKEWEQKAKNWRVPHASTSEIILFNLLVGKGMDIILQQAVGPYNIDLGTFPVAVEVWGGAWHFSKDHTERFRYLFDNGWHLIIVYADPKLSPISIGAADYIVTFFEHTCLDPTTPREYRVIWGNGEIFSAGRFDDDNIARIVPRKHFLDART